MQLLFLTTPLMENLDVARAQRTLQSNPYGNFGPGSVDSVFGTATARACKRAKYWLGYKTSRIAELEGCYGDEIHSYLAGGVRLPAANWIRRRIRLGQQPELPLRVRALNIARTQEGVNEEPPGSNNVLYSRWYLEVARAPAWAYWCAMFVSWCYDRAGSDTFGPNLRYAYCPYILADARRGVNNLAITTSPQAGDIVLYDFRGNGVPGHVGIFEGWSAEGRFWAWEGNTSQSSDDDGGEVQHRLRHRSVVAAFVHVAK